MKSLQAPKVFVGMEWGKAEGRHRNALVNVTYARQTDRQTDRQRDAQTFTVVLSMLLHTKSSSDRQTSKQHLQILERLQSQKGWGLGQEGVADGPCSQAEGQV